MAEIAKEFVFDSAEPRDLVQNEHRVHGEALWKCFPSSTQMAIPFEYQVPRSYLTIDFWNKQLYRLGDWRRMWVKQMTSFKELLHEKRKSGRNSHTSEAHQAMEHVVECYDVLIEHCWAGNMAAPPLPVELWSALMSELQRIDQSAKICIKGMGFNNFMVGTFPEPPVQRVIESGESIAKRLEELGEAGPLFAFIARNLKQFEDFRQRKIIASDCDYSLLTKIIDALKSGKNEMTYPLYNELRRNTEKLFKKVSDASTEDRLPYIHLPSSFDELQEIVAEELGAIKEKPMRKSSRKSRSTLKMEIFEEVEEEVEKKVAAARGRKRAIPAPLAPSASRPKRIRKPARSFTPTQSFDSGNVSEEEKAKEAAKAEEQAALSEVSYHKESSPEMEDFVVVPSPVKTSRKKKNLAAELKTMPDPEEEPILKKKKKRSSQKTAEEIAEDPNEPVTEKDIMLLNERVYMETTRLNLLRLRNNKGEFHYDYIPTILECIDRAVEALDEGHIVDYVMHKASVETGAESILQLSKNNPNTAAEGVMNVSPEDLQDQDPPGSCPSEIIDPVGDDVNYPAADQPSTSAAAYPTLGVDEAGPSYITPTAVYDDSQPYANYGERQLDLAQL